MTITQIAEKMIVFSDGIRTTSVVFLESGYMRS